MGMQEHMKYEQARSGKSRWKRLLPFLGPAFIAGVAYIDPGNFATNIAAGSEFGYLLLWVVLASNLMAILVQSLSAKLGIATGQNLPEVTRDHFPRPATFFMWAQAELVVMATDLAEFIGAALGLHLLFGIGMVPAALLSAVASFALLELQRRGVRTLEVGITALVFIVVLAFGFQVFFAKPDPVGVVKGLFIPQFENTKSVLLAVGILGATVMPHAIYLHSALTQNRIVGGNETQRRSIFKFEFIDILIAMVIAGAVNAAMLIVASAMFFDRGLIIEDLDVAFRQFGSVGNAFVATLFGTALLVSGLASSSVGTMAGDVIMQGYLKFRISLYARRLITIVPPLLIIIAGVNPTYALVLSQVALSFGIPFALIPLIIFTSRKKLMGTLVNARWVTALAWAISLIIIGLNFFLLYDTFRNAL